MNKNESQMKQISVSNKILRSGVSLALIASFSIPTGLTSAYASENAGEGAKVSQEQAQIDTAKTSATQTAKINVSADDPVLAGPVTLQASEQVATIDVSVRGTQDEAYLYFAPTDGVSTECEISWFSPEYFQIKEAYRSSIKAIKVKEGVTIKLTNNDSSQFRQLSNLSDIEGLKAFDVSEISDFSNYFSECSLLTDLSPLANWKMSSATTLKYMFNKCSSLTKLDGLGNWDVTQVTTMQGMFEDCESLTDLRGLASWKVDQNLVSMEDMFAECSALTKLDGLDDWRFGEGLMNQTIEGCFARCTSLTDLSGIANWNLEDYEDLQGVFQGCTSLTDLSPIAGWDVSNADSFQGMFSGCTSLTNVDGLKNWDVSNLKDMATMFMGCSSLSNIDGLKNWKVAGNYLEMTMTFSDCALTNLDAFDSWDMSNIAGNFQMTFRNCFGINKLNLGTWANVIAQGYNQYMFDNIAPSKVREIKMPSLDKEYVSYLTNSLEGDNNILDLEKMFDSSLVYRVKGTETTYSTFKDLMNDYDDIRGKTIEVVNTYTVNFYETDNFDKLPIAIQKIPSGQHPVGVTQPTIKGASFKGWYVKDGAGNVSEFNFVAPVTQDVNVYAEWVETESTSDSNGKGEVLDPDKVVVYVVSATYTDNGVEKPLSDATITFENGKIKVKSDKSADNVKIHVGTNGKAASGIVVNYSGAEATTDANGDAVFYSDRGTTDSNGQVTLVDPATGKKHVVTVTDINKNPLGSVDVQIKNGSVVVTNPVNKNIIVKVQDANKKAEKGVGVAVIGVDGTVRSGKTDANGEYKTTSNSSDSDSDSGDEIGTQVMYRLYNKWTGEHFYTSNADEQKNLVKVGWTDEGTGWIAPKKSDTPVYRLYNKYVEGGDHHYTTSKDERDACVKAGWTDEGIGWYSSTIDEGVPVYRQYNPYAETGTHNFTTSAKEDDNLISVGWISEGTAWYGVKK